MLSFYSCHKGFIFCLQFQLEPLYLSKIFDDGQTDSGSLSAAPAVIAFDKWFPKLRCRISYYRDISVVYPLGKILGVFGQNPTEKQTNLKRTVCKQTVPLADCTGRSCTVVRFPINTDNSR